MGGRREGEAGGGDLKLDLEGPSVPVRPYLVVGVCCRQGLGLACLAARWLNEGPAEEIVDRREKSAASRDLTVRAGLSDRVCCRPALAPSWGGGVERHREGSSCSPRAAGRPCRL